ncbi:MAG: S8 family serine peptidase [Saprospiraceae bacterium]|nr:S8 family serine peptidase [Saprospiraceae bacterium]
MGTSDNIGAFEWAVDPDGNEDTADDIPDVINNSWYDPSLNELDCYSVYVPILQTLEVIGVAVVFSAGNEGPDPGTITQPHNININEVNAFTIGALNGNSSALPIADFSSRGPSHCEGEGSIKIKPEVSAPGVQVRSCVPGNEFALLNGTSMAAPHVSGAILLLKEAFPDLGGKDFKLALYNTCRDLGAPGEDNIFGMGIIDVFAAYEYLVNAGHVPANPYKERDLMLLEAKTSFYACENIVEPFILVENNGVDIVTSFLVEYGGPLETKSFVWTGSMSPKERKYISLEAFLPESDFDMITVSIVSVNDGADERPFNNSISAPIVLSERKKVVADIDETEKICKNSQIVLTSPLGTTGNFTTKWYDDIFDGNLLYTGNLLLLPADESDKTLYAEITYNESFGENAPEENPTPESSLESGLMFDTEFGFTLESFDVYSAQKHTVDVAVLNENNNVVHVISRPQTPIGKRTINVQWYIPPGKNYKLVKKLGKDLYGNKNVFNFPYTIDDVVTIKSGFKNGEAANEYLGFYNLRIKHTEPCGRVPYQFSSSQTDSITSEVLFTLSEDTVRLPNLLEASSLTENVSYVSWDMGDGTRYVDSTVTHEYLSAGTYTICYHVKDENLCSTAGLKDVVVLRTTSTEESTIAEAEEIILYPNPVSDVLFIEKLYKNLSENISVMIYDQNGSRVFSGEWNQGDIWKTDISGLPGGIYYVRLFGQKQVRSQRFVKF